MVLTVRDYVEGCYTNQQGEIIFDLIVPEIRNNRPVVLSFKGITSVSSSFLNTGIVPLLDVTNLDDIKKLLRIVHSNKFINDMIITRLNQENSCITGA